MKKSPFYFSSEQVSGKRINVKRRVDNLARRLKERLAEKQRRRKR